MLHLLQINIFGVLPADGSNFEKLA